MMGAATCAFVNGDPPPVFIFGVPPVLLLSFFLVLYPLFFLYRLSLCLSSLPWHLAALSFGNGLISFTASPALQLPVGITTVQYLFHIMHGSWRPDTQSNFSYVYTYTRRHTHSHAPPPHPPSTSSPSILATEGVCLVCVHRIH